MEPQQPPDDSRFEGLGDWLVTHGQEALARGGSPGRSSRRARIRRLAVAALRVLVPIALVWIALNVCSALLGNYLWFENVGFGSVWTTQFDYFLALFAGGLLGTAVFMVGNLWLAWRVSLDPTDEMVTTRGRNRRADARGEAWLVATAYLPRRRLRRSLIALSLLFALAFSVILATSWQTVALWLHGVPYAASGPTVTDPVFGLDLGWWMFSLPLLHLAAALVGALLLLTLLLTGGAYAVAAVRGADVTRRGPLLHLALLGGLVLVDVAVIQWLGRYDLSYAQNGFVTGVGATDAAVRLPLAAITAAATLVAAILLVALALLRDARLARRMAVAGAAVYFTLLAAGAILPAAYQKLAVAPSQNLAEASYIANNIAMTRQGFALAGWKLESYTGRSSLTAADVSRDQATFDNARLWDPRPLAATLDQLQTIRPYYTFSTVTIDRYDINAQPTEVMLAAREMALKKSNPNPSWIASHVLYTHGYGAVMLPVNAVDPNGLPQLIMQNMPVTEAGGAPSVTQPRIYFGLRPQTWVLVGAKSAEFDYPSTQGNGNDVTTRYTGTAGLPVGSLAERLFWAWNLGDLNLAFTGQVTSQTRLLLNRSLTSRVSALAPFLKLDGDPYLVVAPDGHLVWVQDAYTVSAAMPDATAYRDSTLGATYDYIRNSVKITMDAYGGAVHFYVADPSDPLIRAWEGIFPGMFEPLSAMPSGLQAHLRTPEAMFNAQTQMFATYHVTDVASFYKGDNLWTVPSVSTGGTQVLPPQAYYVEMRLPGESNPEFVLVQPMVPVSRPNMIAWVAARNDGTARGQVIVYELPAGTTIQGPTQIEARIDQDPVISAQLSLWNQSGSRVIRGSMIVLPVGGSFVYLEPVYLQSTSSAFPQLTKIVVATSQTVGWGNTLDQALQSVVTGVGTAGQTATLGGAAPGVSSGSSSGATSSAGQAANLPTDVTGLIQYINSRLAAATADQASGNSAGYAREMQEAQAAVSALDALTGGTPSSPPPSATP